MGEAAQHHPRQRRYVLEQRREAAPVDHLHANLGAGDNTGVANETVEEGELSEVLAWTELCDHDAVAHHVGGARADHQKLVADLALPCDHAAGRHRHLVRQLIDALQLLVAARGEQREFAEAFEEVSVPAHGRHTTGYVEPVINERNRDDANGQRRRAHVIVTGGSSGIGAEVVGRLAVTAVVTNLDRRPPSDESSTLSRVGHEAVAHEVVDVCDSEAVGLAVESAVDRSGPVTALVAVAGVGALKPLHTYSDAEFARLVDVNLTGAFYVVRAVVPSMLETGGAIVTVASASAVTPTFGEAPYAAAKAALVSLTRSIALEYGPRIRANCVSPGLIRTPMSEMVADRAEVVGRIPARRAGEPREVAALVEFLLSDDAAYITGQNVVIDGGALLPQHSVHDLLVGLAGGS